MNILISTRKNARTKYFPPHVIEAYQKIGNVRMNDNDRDFTKEELIENIKEVDVCVTQWEHPNFDEEVLKNAQNLKLIAHAAGSVGFLNGLVYGKGIKVCSANREMAKYVAEGTLAYILSALRKIPLHDKTMKEGLWERYPCGTLLNQKVGLVGLGTIGRFLLEFLKPFNVYIKIYDPYVLPESLMAYSNVELCSLDEVLSWANIISVHAAKTPETYHMLNEKNLKLIKDNAVLVNTARGALIDTAALVSELKEERFFAVIDVYEKEPLVLDSPLRQLRNSILMPHAAGVGIADDEYALVMLDEIKRFFNNEPLLYEVSYSDFKLMTREI